MTFYLKLLSILQFDVSIFFLLIIIFSAVITDVVSNKIPNILVVFGIVLAFYFQVFHVSGYGFFVWLTGLLTGFAIFLPFYFVRGMAAGDVKLMATVGAFVGWGMTLKIALLTCVFGGIIGIVYILIKGRLIQAFRNIGLILMPVFMRSIGVSMELTDISRQSVGHMPYAVAIALGTLTALYMQYWY